MSHKVKSSQDAGISTDSVADVHMEEQKTDEDSNLNIQVYCVEDLHKFRKTLHIKNPVVEDDSKEHAGEFGGNLVSYRTFYTASEKFPTGYRVFNFVRDFDSSAATNKKTTYKFYSIINDKTSKKKFVTTYKKFSFAR